MHSHTIPPSPVTSVKERNSTPKAAPSAIRPIQKPWTTIGSRAMITTPNRGGTQPTERPEDVPVVCVAARSWPCTAIARSRVPPTPSDSFTRPVRTR